MNSQEEVSLKYIFNYGTQQFEPMEPTMRDRFALGGGVIQGEKVGDRENFAKPEIATSRIDRRQDGTFGVRTKYKSTERYPDGSLKAKYYKFNTYKEAKNFLKEIRDDIYTRSIKDSKVLKNINSWTEKFFKNNIKKFEVSDYDSFVKKMQEDWAQELKNNAEKYKGQQKKLVSDNDGLPRTERMKVFGLTSPEKGQIETHGPGVAYYQRAFFKGKLDTDAKLKSGLKEYMQWSLSKGEGQPAAYKADRRDFLKAAQGLDNFDKNVLYFLGEGYDQFKYGQGGANFKNVMDKTFPDIFPKYHKKINLAKGEYFTNLKKVSDLAGVDFNTVVNNIRKENAKVKQILKLDKLPPDMKTGYSGDHLGGIKTAIITNDRNFARKVLENVVGSTRQRNTELGYKLLEQPKNRLVKKYLKAKTRTEKQTIVNDINKLIEKYDPDTQKFKIGKGGKLDFDPLIVQKTPEEKAKGYQQAAKKFFPASTVKKLKEMGVNLFTKLEKGSRTRKQFEALVPGKFDAAVLTPYDYITSIAAGYSIPESSLIAASNLLPRKVQKILPSMLGIYDIQKEATDKFETVFNLGDGEETKTGKKIRTTIEDLIGKVKDRFGDDSIGTADDVQEPESAERRRMFEEANERLGNIDEMEISDIDNPFMAAMGGRVGFKDGTPDPFVDEALAALESANVADQFIKDNSPSVEQQIFGAKDDRSLMQKFNTQFLDPRSYPYYAQKLARGAANIPEFILSTPKAGFAFIEDLRKNAGITKGGIEEVLKILDPSITRDILDGKFGDLLGISPKEIQASEEKRTGPQRTTGSLLELAGELPGPATPFFLIGYAPKLLKQLRDLGATGAAVDKINKEIENKVAQQGVNQTRRDIVLSIGAGGAVAFLKYLGLDFLSKAPKVAEAAPKIITKGGTPKYFFDFVGLIKRKGKDISDTAATVERQKVYDYNGYTLYEDLSTGKIRVTKENEGSGSYYVGDGEYDTYDGIVSKEEINYEPPETVLDDAGKSKQTSDFYEEGTLLPDVDGSEGDVEAGLESIDQILELLAKDGTEYTAKELEEMGINIPQKDLPIRSDKAEGGIIAGVSSGPPPTSGPTPHGLSYVAKNVRPIKERK